jgi:hypothetical protein
MIFNIISKKIQIFILTLSILIFNYNKCFSWGFNAHKTIVRTAVYILPFEMIGFYKKHIDYLAEHSGDPDKRKFVDEKEGQNHYIDIDYYRNIPFDSIPRNWCNAVAKFTEDTLLKYGIAPWHIMSVFYSLTESFRQKDYQKIIHYSTYISHYISDIHVPFHCTQYYDGKTPSQKGIHSLFETKIPDLLSQKYDFWIGKPEYLNNPSQNLWNIIKENNDIVDSLFNAMDRLNSYFPEDLRYVYESKGNLTNKNFTDEYAMEFNKLTGDIVEQRMKESIYLTACFWYTAWVNAGQPDLN